MRLGEFGRSMGSAVLKRVGRAAGRFQEESWLATDVLESDDEYLVVFDAPGANASDVQVRYQDGAVLVRLDRFRAFREGFEMVFPGRGLALDGRAELPEDAVVDPDRARARLDENGTLSVFLPKADEGADIEVTGAEREASSIPTPASSGPEGDEE